VAKLMLRMCLGDTMKNPKVFGANPDEFDPSRWMANHELDNSRSKHVGDMTDILELNFGSGGSKCLGRHVALLEHIVALSKVVLIR
jgi:cytochrome P450